MLWGTADKSVLAVDFHVCTCLGIIDLSSSPPSHPAPVSHPECLLLEGLVLLHAGGMVLENRLWRRSFLFFRNNQDLPRLLLFSADWKPQQVRPCALHCAGYIVDVQLNI